MTNQEPIGVGVLSKKIRNRYSYYETKKNIDEIMLQIEEYRFRVHNIQPPRITPSYEIRYEGACSSTPKSKVEEYVTKLIDLEIEAGELYKTLELALKNMCKNELIYFKCSYYDHISEKDISDITYLSSEQIKTIKESCIIKLGLVFDVCVKTTGR